MQQLIGDSGPDRERSCTNAVFPHQFGFPLYAVGLLKLSQFITYPIDLAAIET